MAGRRPRPTRIKALSGTLRPSRANPQEPKPAAGAPPPPPHLSAEALQEWNRVAPLLVELGVLSHLDRATLAGYCSEWGRWIEAERVLAADGLSYATPQGLVRKRPEVAIAAESLRQMRAFAVELGMTPASRSKVHASTPVKDDPVEAYFFGTGPRPA